MTAAVGGQARNDSMIRAGGALFLGGSVVAAGGALAAIASESTTKLHRAAEDARRADVRAWTPPPPAGTAAEAHDTVRRAFANGNEIGIAGDRRVNAAGVTADAFATPDAALRRLHGSPGVVVRNGDWFVGVAAPDLAGKQHLWPLNDTIVQAQSDRRLPIPVGAPDARTAASRLASAERALPELGRDVERSAARAGRASLLAAAASGVALIGAGVAYHGRAHSD